MPQTQVLFYCEPDGDAPVRKWLNELRWRDRRGFARCVDRLRSLAAMGRELRRPHADYLRDGIYELRARAGSVNYRILYFFHGKDTVVLAHGLKKEAEIPTADLDRAIERKRAFEADPGLHTAEDDDE